MSDSATLGKSRLWIERLLGVAIVCGFSLWMMSPVSPKGIPAVVAANHGAAIQTSVALIAFAGDHSGEYPRVLQELSPDYLPELTGYRDTLEGPKFDWFYVAGLRRSSPVDWIVFASPTDQTSANSQRHARLVITNAGSITTIPEDEFERKLAEQVKALAAQTPEKP